MLVSNPLMHCTSTTLDSTLYQSSLDHYTPSMLHILHKAMHKGACLCCITAGLPIHQGQPLRSRQALGSKTYCTRTPWDTLASCALQHSSRYQPAAADAAAKAMHTRASPGAAACCCRCRLHATAAAALLLPSHFPPACSLVAQQLAAPGSALGALRLTACCHATYITRRWCWHCQQCHATPGPMLSWGCLAGKSNGQLACVQDCTWHGATGACPGLL